VATRSERKELIAGQRKSQILEAALNVFSRKGFGEATVPDVAEEAGVAVGTIYNYFESKKDLLTSIFNTYVVATPFMDILEGSLESDDWEFVTSVIENRLDFGFENMDRLPFVFAEIQRDPELREQFAEQFFGPILLYPERFLESRMASGAFKPANARVMARAMVGMVLGFLLLYSVERDRSPCEAVPRKELAAQLAQFVLGGLRGSRGGGTP
jgi:AcrR family transcriptional regulator